MPTSNNGLWYVNSLFKIWKIKVWFRVRGYIGWCHATPLSRSDSNPIHFRRFGWIAYTRISERLHNALNIAGAHCLLIFQIIEHQNVVTIPYQLSVSIEIKWHHFLENKINSIQSSELQIQTFVSKIVQPEKYRKSVVILFPFQT